MSTAVEITRTRLDKLQSRWSLFLAIGNGAALAALGTKVLDVLAKPGEGTEHMVALAFFPMLSFAVGLIWAASIPLMELRGAQKRLREYRQGQPKKTAVNEDLITGDDHWDQFRNWIPEIGAAAFFCMGMLIIIGILMNSFSMANLNH
jgi:hypothetical protein